MGMDGHQCFFDKTNGKKVNDGADVILCTSNDIYCNVCDKVKLATDRYNGKSSVGMVLNDTTATLDGVFVCHCGTVFVIDDNKKKDLYSFAHGRKKRINDDFDSYDDFWS